ncbi:MAG: capsule assembly Wzi family protein [Spirochaetota bacterium]
MRHPTHYIVLFIAIMVLSQPVSSAPLRMVGVGDPILEDYAFLIRTSEESVVSLTPPLSSEEILGNLRTLSVANRSPAWKAAYARIIRALQENPILKDGALGVTVHPELAVEGRWRSNPKLDWVREEKQNPALLTLPLEFFFANTLYARADLIIRNDPLFYNDDNSYGTNLLMDVNELDLNMPLKAFIAAGGPWWSFQLGRDRLSFGTGHTGNLAISDTPDYYDFARLSLFSPNFKYSLLVTQLPLETPEYFFASGFEPSGTVLRGTTQRFLYLHRWDLRLWKRLSLGISEGVMVGNSPLELRFLNPLTVYHSFFSWNDYPKWIDSNYFSDMNGSIASLDIEWALGGGISLYGQMVMNQYASPYEQEHWPEVGLPNGLGWLGGVEYEGDVAGWRSIYFLEAVYTDPYLYTLGSPFASFIWMRHLSDLIAKPRRYMWIGYPEGRDIISINFGVKMTKDPVRFSWQLEYINRGEHSIQWDWTNGPDAFRQTTPTGIPEQSWTLSSECTWNVIKPLSLTLFGSLQWIENFEHQNGIDSFGSECGLSARYIF